MKCWRHAHVTLIDELNRSEAARRYPNLDRSSKAKKNRILEEINLFSSDTASLRFVQLRYEKERARAESACCVRGGCTDEYSIRLRERKVQARQDKKRNIIGDRGQGD